MAESLTPAVGRRFARLKREAAREWRSRQVATARAARRAAHRWRRRLRRAGLFALTALVLGALPFVALVRGSVFLHQHRGLPAWLALTLGGVTTAALVGVYAAWLLRRVTGRARLGAALRWFGLPLVGFYAVFALVFISSANLQRPALRAHYRELHPLLRVGLCTLILMEGDLVLTDLARRPGDYRRMGLPERETSLHFRQDDGWVHAVDLRTAGRSRLTNGLVEWYFRGMGFTTVRHIGTADHLHVALPQPS